MRNYIKTILIFFITILIFYIINQSAKFYLKKKIVNTFNLDFINDVYGKENYNDYSQVLSQLNIPLTYFPFIEFKESPRNHKFVTVNENGIRCNENSVNTCNGPSGGKNEIWVFGGSTIFGYGVKNDETIPAYLDKMFKDKDVINIGSGYWYSTQERLAYLNMLTELDPPHLTIFIDGLNELVNFKDESLISNRLDYLYNSSSNELIKSKIVSRINSLHISKLLKYLFNNNEKKNIETLYSKDEIEKKVLRFIRNHNINYSVSKMSDIDFLHVLQPLPIYENSYDNSNFPKDFEKISNVFKKNLTSFYDEIDKKENSLFLYKDNYLDLSQFNINKIMYVDKVHYSPIYNKAIAEEIYKYIDQKN